MNLVRKAKNFLGAVKLLKHENRETRSLIGTMLSKNILKARSLKEAEFKVFSQFGDDGIIQYLINKLPIEVEKFVEFGVENYEESNTRFLLNNNNWQGLVIDGSSDNIAYIKNDPIYWRHDVTAVSSFITADNINHIISDNGFNGKVGILSIDIDGNDYWIWKAISVIEADIVIVEYNSLFGIDRAITIPYEADFTRHKGHYSGLYWGASLTAFYYLAKEKGYSFIGCNQAGVNAYFIKNYLTTSIAAIPIEKGYVKSKVREARDRAGILTFASEENRRREIIGMPVVNINTGLTESI